MDKVKQFIEANKERFLEELFELIRIPSVSSISDHKPDMIRAAEKYKEHFLKTYMNGKNMNENIEKEFYNKKEYNTIMKEDNNELEVAWKTRILYENTPKGPIFMHYDAYKQGFSYYADQTSIPFNILNAVAMKYVCRFYCRDFYYDEMSLKEKKEIDKEEVEAKNIIRRETTVRRSGPDLKSLSTAKHRNPSDETYPSEFKEEDEEEDNHKRNTERTL